LLGLLAGASSSSPSAPQTGSRSADRPFGWLPRSVTTGLAGAAGCNLIGATTMPAVPVVGVIIFIVVMLLS
jgi:hypothetical protein